MYWPWIIGLLALLGLRKVGQAMTLPDAPHPPVRPSDWTGWVWPVPIWKGRVPVRTQEWKPGHDPGFGNSSGASSNHLGIDIMFQKLPSDPKEAVRHDATRSFIAPAGTPIIASGPGRVWSTGVTGYGHNILIDHGQVGTIPGVNTWYQHLESFSRDWKKGDLVNPGDVLGFMGYSSANGDPEGLRHLHFELRFPALGTNQDSWRQNPEPYMKGWHKIVPNPAVV